MTVWILAFYSAHRWRDLLSLQFGNPVTCCFDAAVVLNLQPPAAFAAPGAGWTARPIDRPAFLGWPFPLVLRPYPAEFRDLLVPRLRRGLLLGRDPLRRDGLFLGLGYA